MEVEVSFVSIFVFTLHPDELSLNGSVMIINQSINQIVENDGVVDPNTGISDGAADDGAR